MFYIVFWILDLFIEKDLTGSAVLLDYILLVFGGKDFRDSGVWRNRPPRFLIVVWDGEQSRSVACVQRAERALPFLSRSFRGWTTTRWCPTTWPLGRRGGWSQPGVQRRIRLHAHVGENQIRIHLGCRLVDPHRHVFTIYELFDKCQTLAASFWCSIQIFGSWIIMKGIVSIVFLLLPVR